jgi:hypothetical protein
MAQLRVTKNDAGIFVVSLDDRIGPTGEFRVIARGEKQGLKDQLLRELEPWVERRRELRAAARRLRAH